MIKQYLDEIKKEFDNNLTTEHSYRPALKNLIQKLYPTLLAVNEPTRQKCGAPDYVILRNSVQIGYFECKDIDVNLDTIEKSNQMNRYRKSLDNLILTNHLEFRYYVNGQKIDSIQVAILENGKIKYLQNHFEKLLTIIDTFVSRKPQPVKSSKKLSEIMAQKSILIKQTTINLLKSIEEPSKHLTNLLNYFKKVLIHDLDVESFADMYAQTIAYGLFVARLNDTTLETFSREEARELVSKNNPFLRDLFDYISGAKLDDNLKWIVEDLVEVFRLTDVKNIILKEQKNDEEDAFLHFYETFLEAFDKEEKKNRGVYYTKPPIVKFIINSIDELLKCEFNLKLGLADNTKVNMNEFLYKDNSKYGKGKNVYGDNKEIFKVQILDPATGTGTFLVETVNKIMKAYEKQKGQWNNIINDILIDRINGFEVMMTPYTMCHLKLSMALQSMGIDNVSSEKRFKVYLTNSLENKREEENTLFDFLTDEAKSANGIKNETPIMVVIGNPPYKGESANGSLYNDELEEYKLEPNSKGANGKPLKLQEKNPKWINNDYVKFIRLAQKFVDKNNEGIIGYINSHSYIDSPSFRGMRFSLLKSFDEIYILNLHGNSNKESFSIKDENVFDIQEGVCINIFVKTGKKKQSELAKVYYKDLIGTRKDKFNYLLENSLKTVDFVELKPEKPYYYMYPINTDNKRKYNKYISIDKIFDKHSNGIGVGKCNVTIRYSEKELKTNIQKFVKMDVEDARIFYNLGKDTDWTIINAQRDLINSGLNDKYISKISYRVFDNRYTYYTGNNNAFHSRPRKDIMQHFVEHENLGLICNNSIKNQGSQPYFITDSIFDLHILETMNATAQCFPLYIYPQNNTLFETDRKVNIKDNFISLLENKLNLKFDDKNESVSEKFTPENILDYIYATFYSNKYRKEYNDLLKIGYPKIPLPKNTTYFFKMVDLGNKLRKYHLMKDITILDYITSYENPGSHEIKNISYIDNKVFINESQSFDNVTEDVYNFKIGSYQPANKWLKDRKGRILTTDDINHYQKMIVAISKTIEIMEEIDKIIEL